MTNSVLEKLWMLAEAEDKRGVDPKVDFYDIGLDLHMPLINEGYFPTPINTSTFARTGGDFVHYGLLHISGDVTEKSPVIMTVPFNSDQPNFVLGENLHEFLCLGCEVGYFGLEQLAYQWEETVGMLERANYPDRKDCDAENREALTILSQALSLTPWNHVQQRLEQLHEQYSDLLELPTDL